MGALAVQHPFPFFKETETNKSCCGCGPNGNSAPATGDFPQVTANNPAMFRVSPSSNIINKGDDIYQVNNSASIQMLGKPEPIGNPQYAYQSKGEHVNLHSLSLDAARYNK